MTPPALARASVLGRLPRWLVELRPHHWIKNSLVFVPLAAAHELGDLTLIARGLTAFAAFSLCASGQYVLNDLLDLESDRAHASKARRPLAAGEITPATAIAMIVVSWGIATLISLRLGIAFTAMLAGYILLMIAYSLWLKRIVLLDALLLATGYSMRVAAGALAAAILPSPWLIAFCVAFFYSLALVKRYAELAVNRERDGRAAHARGYEAVDLPMVAMFGIASGYLSVLVLALYLTTGASFRLLYARPAFIGLTAVLLMYWISYVWLIANRGQLTDDPVIFALRNRQSQVLVVLMGVCAWLAV